ncbi:hypothetical protein RUM43_005589 [Polyplax serrata]|uniref:Uncharacterized protein n=1 Tax=Polyplax serrata TaxID=468196 RepID=A0AAN8PBE8_POLSC
MLAYFLRISGWFKSNHPVDSGDRVGSCSCYIRLVLNYFHIKQEISVFFIGSSNPKRQSEGIFQYNSIFRYKKKLESDLRRLVHQGRCQQDYRKSGERSEGPTPPLSTEGLVLLTQVRFLRDILLSINHFRLLIEFVYGVRCKKDSVLTSFEVEKQRLFSAL